MLRLLPLKFLMSALGHKQTFAVQTGMSALPPKADMCSAQADVRFVPADIATDQCDVCFAPNRTFASKAVLASGWLTASTLYKHRLET